MGDQPRSSLYRFTTTSFVFPSTTAGAGGVPAYLAALIGTGTVEHVLLLFLKMSPDPGGYLPKLPVRMIEELPVRLA